MAGPTPTASLSVYASVGASETSKLWYLDNNKLGPDLNIASVWEDYRGEGVKIAVFDSMPYISHPDLVGSYDTSLDYDLTGRTDALSYSYGKVGTHGTLVAGVIGATDNSTGAVGVAFGARLAGLSFDYASATVGDDLRLGFSMADDYDVVNCSWSYVSAFGDTHMAPHLAGPVGTGRDGLGTIMVYSAGNSAWTKGANYNALQGSPLAIAVGAVKPDGNAAPFSQAGPNVLVTAGGTNVYTTKDLGAYTSTASGTSFSAPQVSGVAALMLQANDDLGYRDVQQILALSGRMDALKDAGPYSSGTLENHAGNFNGGGMHFNDVFGYGFVDAHAAVRLAETWTEQQTLANRLTTTGSVEYASYGKLFGKGVTELHGTVTLAGNVEAEHVQLKMDWTGIDDAADMDVYLTSPDGTRVRVFYDLPGTEGVGALSGFPLMSVATMGEDVQGTWTVDIYDRTPGPYGTAYLKGLTVTAYGHVDDATDTYFYTDEFAAMTGAARGVLADTDGGVDTINAAAVSSYSIINLVAGASSQIDGRALVLDGTIENAFGGDGGDTITGNASDNMLSGGRGDDTIVFSTGRDVVHGGAGDDTAAFSFASTAVTSVDVVDGVATILVGLSRTIADGIERFVFSDGSYAIGNIEDTIGDPTPTPPPPPPAPLNLKGTSANDHLVGAGGNDMITGKSGNDVSEGLAGNDMISDATSGNDLLLGGAGNDTLDGWNDNDTLVGGLGQDVLKGKTGADTFVLDTLEIGVVDTVYDFSLAERDRIDLGALEGVELDLVHTRTDSRIVAIVDDVASDVAIMRGTALSGATFDSLVDRGVFFV